MNQRDIVINLVLTAMIGGVIYLIATFEPTQPVPPSIALVNTAVTPAPETPVGPRPAITPSDIVAEVNPFRTIITPTPRPTPTPKPIPTPPPIGAAMAQYTLLMMDPPRSVMLQDKRSKKMITWKVGQTQTLKSMNRDLEVTLKKVDPNTFRAIFTAPKNQEFVFKFF